MHRYLQSQGLRRSVGTPLKPCVVKYFQPPVYPREYAIYAFITQPTLHASHLTLLCECRHSCRVYDGYIHMCTLIPYHLTVYLFCSLRSCLPLNQTDVTRSILSSIWQHIYRPTVEIYSASLRELTCYHNYNL